MSTSTIPWPITATSDVIGWASARPGDHVLLRSPSERVQGPVYAIQEVLEHVGMDESTAEYSVLNVVLIANNANALAQPEVGRESFDHDYWQVWRDFAQTDAPSYEVRDVCKVIDRLVTQPKMQDVYIAVSFSAPDTWDASSILEVIKRAVGANTAHSDVELSVSMSRTFNTEVKS